MLNPIKLPANDLDKVRKINFIYLYFKKLVRAIKKTKLVEKGQGV